MSDVLCVMCNVQPIRQADVGAVGGYAQVPVLLAIVRLVWDCHSVVLQELSIR